MADYLPVYISEGVQPFTATCSADVTGGHVVVWSGAGTVAGSGADSAVVAGVAAHDAKNGGRVSVWPLEGVIHELLATGAISAGAGVVTDAATGTVKTASIATAAAAGTLIGTAVTAASGSPSKLRVHGRR